MKRVSFVLLGATTVATIAVMWSRDKWATSIPEVAMCLIALLWGLQMTLGRTVRSAAVMLPLALVILLAGLQIMTGTTVYAWTTRMAALYWAGNLATFFVALQVLTERESRLRYFNALLGFATFVCLFSSVQAMTSTGTIYWTFKDKFLYTPLFGPFLYINQYAAFVELVLPIAIYGALTRQKGKVLCILASAVMVGSVVYSGSRGGSALVLLEVAVVPFLVARRWGITRQQLINTGVVLAVALLWVGVAAGPERLVSKLSSDDTMAVRRDFNQSSLAMIKARPLQGFGLGNWATAYPGYASFDDGKYANQAHNDWAQWTVEGGIPMLILMLLVAGWAIPRAWRSGWGFGVVAIFLHCLWDYPIQRTGVAIVFFTMLAAIAPYGAAAVKESTAEENEEYE